MAKRFWVIVPAAGIGKRFASDLPKQYHQLRHQTVADCTLERLLNFAVFERVVLVLAKADIDHVHLKWLNHPKLQLHFSDRQQRQDSVNNGLQALNSDAHSDDWVFVHDVVRPCLTHDDLNKLVGFCMRCSLDAAAGCLLASPCVDSLKSVVPTMQSESSQDFIVKHSIEREQIWRALTPQVFPYGILKSALSYVNSHGLAVGDEAEACAHMKIPISVIEGRSDNLKITYESDLLLAEAILESQSGNT